jgi:hypothetical protein
MNSEPLIDLLHFAYRKWAGEPFSVSTFRRENTSPTALPILDVLCYRSSDRDELRPENEFTFLATAGLSMLSFPPPWERIELIWRIAGRRSWGEIQALAEGLATIAALPMYGPVVFTPGAIIRNISLPLFDRMDSLLITHWGMRSPEYLPGFQQPLLLLAIKALFGSEAAMAASVGGQEVCNRFLAEGLDCDDPCRPRLAPQAPEC